MRDLSKVFFTRVCFVIALGFISLVGPSESRGQSSSGLPGGARIASLQQLGPANNSAFVNSGVTLVELSAPASAPASAGRKAIAVVNQQGTGPVYTCDPSVLTATCNYLNTTIAALYTNTFSNVNASIYVTFGVTGLGQNFTALNGVSYTGFQAALAAAQSDTNDATAISVDVPAMNPPYGAVVMTNANARALGFAGPYGGLTPAGQGCDLPATGCYDSILTVSSAMLNAGNLYFRTGTITPNQYDFYSVVEHETDEVLGTSSCAFGECDFSGVNYVEPADFFRYSSSGALTLVAGTNNSCASSDATNACFSLNGTAMLQQYNNLNNGEDAGDWVPNCITPLVQNAEGCPGVANLDISPAAEILVLDVVGYNRVASLATNAGTTPQFEGTNTNFGVALSVTAKDGGGNLLSGATVTFTAPASGASGVFSNNTNTITVTSNSSGVASAPISANGTVGSYFVTAVAGNVSTFFSLNNTNGAASSIVVAPGSTPQSVSVDSAFANALAVTVRDASNNPLAGQNVLFTAPASGASGTFSNNGASIFVTTNASGVASAAFRANGTLGSYVVTAAVGARSTGFSLTNLTGPPTFIISNEAVPPWFTPTGGAVANGLGVTVQDAGHNAVAGVNVVFTAPATGASLRFSNSTNTIVIATNTAGAALAPATANAIAGGPYSVTAAAGALSTTFSQVNTGPPASMTANTGTTPQSMTVNNIALTNLGVAVKDANGNPISGLNVVFTAPASGPSGSMSPQGGPSSNPATAVTDLYGMATTRFTANTIAGGPYLVTAVLGGLSTSFSLTNRPGGPDSITINAGSSPQSANVGAAFANPLSVTVRDGSNNPVPGASVGFSAPVSGASGTFSNNTNGISATTNASGTASVPFSANGIPGGPYSVIASVQSQSSTLLRNFSLTNAAIVAAGSPANVGVFRNGYYWLEDVDGNRQFDSPPDRAFGFGGIAGDIPITGDWSGNGTTKVGIYRPSNGLFILDYNGDGIFEQGTDLVYNLGVGVDATDVPVVGDWNGSGTTKVGLFRQGFFWILDTNGDGVFTQGTDATFAFGGVAGDRPVVGDWTGTGTSKIGLFRLGFYWILDANGNGTLDNVNGAGGDQAFAYGGLAGDVPVVGDWNGSGTSKVGVFRDGFFWVLDANGNHTFDGTGGGQDLAFPFGGIAGDIPVVGKW